MAMYTPSAYYPQPGIIVSPPQLKKAYPIAGGGQGSPAHFNGAASTPFLPMSIPLPSSLNDSMSMAAAVSVPSATKLHAHQMTGGYSSSNSSGRHSTTSANHRHSKYSYAGSAYYPSAWDFAASTPPKDDALNSGSGLGYHGTQQQPVPLYPLQSQSRHHQQQHSSHGRQHSGSYNGSYNGPLGFSTHHPSSYTQQPNYRMDSPQQQQQLQQPQQYPQYLDANARHNTSGSHTSAPLASSMPACVPMPILKNSVNKPRKRVTFADPLVTYLEAASAPSSVPFAEQMGHTSRRNSMYISSGAGLSRTASLSDNSPPRMDTHRSQGSHGSGRHRHKYRHSINGFANIINDGSSSGSYDLLEQNRHRHNQLCFDESSTFRLEKLKLAHEHRDSHHSHNHPHHHSASCHHRHRSNQNSKTAHSNSSSPPQSQTGDSAAGAARQQYHHYDERFAHAMEHLPINLQPSS
ncbi:hypothetical protein EV175_000423 [Coemansia sp. RSA 1933]|nr:hypothetical protein EV175_000423 [Coemansia sp. RSA 1933]